MQKNTSITLGKHFEQFIASQIASGQYATASETVRAGLRLLQERQMKLEALREAIRIGTESEDVEDPSLATLLRALDEE